MDIVIFTKYLAEADDGPFPWDVTKQAKPKFDITPTEKSCSPAPVQKMRPVSWQSHVRGTMNDPRITSMMDEIEEHESISLWLPTRATSAGLVLQHCLQVIDAIYESHAPLIYKVGFTHNVIHRWSNHRYGYMWEKDKWQKMVVLFISKEPWSIAMLEAALIDRYLGALAALGCYQLWLQHVQTGVILCNLPISNRPRQGQPGCKNVRRGGDSVCHHEDASEAYMVYMVYRSFKVKPP